MGLLFRSVQMVFVFGLCLGLSGCLGGEGEVTAKDLFAEIGLLSVFKPFQERKFDSESSPTELEMKSGKRIFKVSIFPYYDGSPEKDYQNFLKNDPAFSTYVIRSKDIRLGQRSGYAYLYGGDFKAGDQKLPKYYYIKVFAKRFKVSVFYADHRPVFTEKDQTIRMSREQKWARRLARKTQLDRLMKAVERQLGSIAYLKASDTPVAPDTLMPLAKTPEGKLFCGTDDALTAPSLFEKRIQTLATETLRAAKGNIDPGKQLFPDGAYNPIIGSKSSVLLGSDIFEITAKNVVPADVRETNIFAAASAGAEALLGQKILRAKDLSLEPADVMRMALEASEGNYPLAVLAVNGVLKQVTMKGRHSLTTMNDDRKDRLVKIAKAPKNLSFHVSKYQPELDQYRKKLSLQNRIVTKLKSLRADPGKICDKMGPWYHIFTILSIGAVSGAHDADFARFSEHAAKNVKFFLNEGGYNLEKAAIDKAFSKTVAFGVETYLRFEAKR